MVAERQSAAKQPQVLATCGDGVRRRLGCAAAEKFLFQDGRGWPVPDEYL